jgi:hypothetical protein
VTVTTVDRQQWWSNCYSEFHSVDRVAVLQTNLEHPKTQHPTPHPHHTSTRHIYAKRVSHPFPLAHISPTPTRNRTPATHFQHQEFVRRVLDKTCSSAKTNGFRPSNCLSTLFAGSLVSSSNLGPGVVVFFLENQYSDQKPELWLRKAGLWPRNQNSDRETRTLTEKSRTLTNKPELWPRKAGLWPRKQNSDRKKQDSDQKKQLWLKVRVLTRSKSGILTLSRGVLAHLTVFRRLDFFFRSSKHFKIPRWMRSW